MDAHFKTTRSDFHVRNDNDISGNSCSVTAIGIGWTFGHVRRTMACVNSVYDGYTKMIGVGMGGGNKRVTRIESGPGFGSLIVLQY